MQSPHSATKAQLPNAAMYAQFRERYPNGSLKTTLLRREDGEYVVQAVAQAGDITLGSAMAAAPQIEQAEDRALERALRMAGITGQPPASTQSTYGMQVTLMSNHSTGPAELPASRPNALPEMAPPALEMEAMPESREVSRPSLRSAQAERGATNGKKANASARLTAPVDLSSAMAQIDVEIVRLGWDANIGSRHLQLTYGKKSRKQLTDDELLDFLSYLKVQPTPGVDESPF
ncbi:hypothetical protein [Leptolyngbya sp. FACHB-261]|uniref:hypothetical protein n=1 Tax=Leptolyngbya sp. FACHB-261 TaxID=2692806 RepID=UPI00168637E3|nr:hypothetical protein [Leptolyngbya sp. FACHB-261]